MRWGKAPSLSLGSYSRGPCDIGVDPLEHVSAKRLLTVLDSRQNFLRVHLFHRSVRSWFNAVLAKNVFEVMIKVKL